MTDQERYAKAYEHLLYAYALMKDAECDSVTLKCVDYAMIEAAKRTVPDRAK